MASPKRERVYLVPWAVYSPVMASGLVLAWAIFRSAWALVALPFVWLGSSGAAPNLNLANGCLAYTSMLVGFLISRVHEPLGWAIWAGAAMGYYTGVIEQRVRMRPYVKDA